MIIFIFIALLLLLMPLVALMVYLYQHRLSNGAVAKLRKVIFFVTGAHFLLLFAEWIATFLSLINYRPGNSSFLVILLFALPIAIVCFTNWWALINIRKLL